MSALYALAFMCIGSLCWGYTEAVCGLVPFSCGLQQGAARERAYLLGEKGEPGCTSGVLIDLVTA